MEVEPSYQEVFRSLTGRGSREEQTSRVISDLVDPSDLVRLYPSYRTVDPETTVRGDLCLTRNYDIGSVRITASRMVDPHPYDDRPLGVDVTFTTGT